MLWQVWTGKIVDYAWSRDGLQFSDCTVTLLVWHSAIMQVHQSKGLSVNRFSRTLLQTPAKDCSLWLSCSRHRTRILVKKATIENQNTNTYFSRISIFLNSGFRKIRNNSSFQWIWKLVIKSVTRVGSWGGLTPASITQLLTHFPSCLWQLDRGE